jgi:glycerol uptake facilitator-like aquaporin
MATPSHADKTEHGYIDLEAHEASMNGVAPAVNHARFAIKNPFVRELFAEFVAVFVMMLFGLGATCQSILSDSKYGDFTLIVFGWGIGVLFGIHSGGGVSGSHLNPAVTTTAALFGIFPWKKVSGYVAVQTLATYLAAIMIYVLHRPLLNVADPDRLTTHAIFATYPNEYVSNGVGFLTEMFATALLVGGIFAVLDQHNRPASGFSAEGIASRLFFLMSCLVVKVEFWERSNCHRDEASLLASQQVALVSGRGVHERSGYVRPAGVFVHRTWKRSLDPLGVLSVALAPAAYRAAACRRRG